MDEKLTLQIQEWLDTPADDRNIAVGAELMLKLNRNRILYQNVISKGCRMMGKVEYELKKYLRLRLDNKTIADVVRMQTEIVPRVEETIAHFTERVAPESEYSGKRADHDELPAEIQQLWDGNFDRYTKIKALFEELKAMEKQQPCDRYEKLKLLHEADKAYREALTKYDSYVKERNSPEDVDDKEDNFPIKSEEQPLDPAELATQIGNARKYISEGKGKLKKLIEEGNETKADALRAKIVERARIIQQAGAPISDDTLAELSELGINL